MNKQVIDFINEAVPNDIIYNYFMSKYCYYFATILRAAFNRGAICWCAPYSHICWKDVDGTPYDAGGVVQEYEHLIPIWIIKDAADDFKHIPGVDSSFTKEDMQKYIGIYLAFTNKGE